MLVVLLSRALMSWFKSVYRLRSVNFRFSFIPTKIQTLEQVKPFRYLALSCICPALTQQACHCWWSEKILSDESHSLPRKYTKTCWMKKKGQEFLVVQSTFSANLLLLWMVSCALTPGKFNTDHFMFACMTKLVTFVAPTCERFCRYNSQFYSPFLCVAVEVWIY